MALEPNEGNLSEYLSENNNLLEEVKDAVEGSEIDISTLAKEAKQDAQIVLETAIKNAILALAKLTDTQPVSVSTLPLPTGASLEATQILVKDAVLALQSALPLPNGAATQTTLAALLTATNLLAKLTDTQPVSIQTGAVGSMLQEIQTTGLWRGKIAKAYNLIGQRNGFTSNSIMNDIKEYDNGVANVAITANSTLDIISSSASDAAAGTGARTVKVTYINSSNNLVESAAIALNGTTLVTSVLTGVNQVLWMETATAGSGGVAAGNIRLRINGGVVEVEQITAGGNKSRSAIFMIPTGYTGYVASWRVSSIQNDQDVRLRGTVNTFDNSLATLYHYMSQKYAANNTSIPSHDIWLKIPALARVKASTVSAGTAATVRCNVNILIVIIQD